MIPLLRDKFPNSTAELAAAMDESLRQYVQKEEPVVTINARVFPYLDEIALNFDGADARFKPAGPAETRRRNQTGLRSGNREFERPQDFAARCAD